MHEFSIVQSLLSAANKVARERGAKRVQRLWLRLGELSGVDPQSLTSAFELLQQMGQAGQATLEVEHVAACWKCPCCGPDEPPYVSLRCTRCGSSVALTQGDEITLNQIELEYDDV